MLLDKGRTEPNHGRPFSTMTVPSGQCRRHACVLILCQENPLQYRTFAECCSTATLIDLDKIISRVRLLAVRKPLHNWNEAFLVDPSRKFSPDRASRFGRHLVSFQDRLITNRLSRLEPECIRYIVLSESNHGAPRMLSCLT